MLGIFPADEAGLYDSPVETSVQFVGGTAVQLVPYDPTRVALLIGSAPNTTGVLSVTGTGSLHGGLTISTNGAPYLQFTYPNDGPAAQSSWWIVSTSGAGVYYAVSWSLRRNPRSAGYDVFAKQKGDEPHASYHLSAPSRGAVKVPSNQAILRFLREKRPDLFGEQ